jgi:hypothetical protein
MDTKAAPKIKGVKPKRQDFRITPMKKMRSKNDVFKDVTSAQSKKKS